jgi:hypothetical protein
MEKLQALQAAAREGGFVQVEECDEGTVLWLRKEAPDAGTNTHQRICIDSLSNSLTVYWMSALGKIDSKTFRNAPSLQEWFALQPSRMTSREAILRLSANAGDGLAMTGLHDNNAEVIRAAVTRYFGVGPIADKAEGVLMQRMADHARSYREQENPDEWLARCANTECDRLRNEGIHDKANGDRLHQQ